LKRSTISLEDRERIGSLFQDLFHSEPALQTRLLAILTKSAVSTTFTLEVVKIVRQGIQPDDSTNLPAKGLETVKFRNALFHYMNWVSRMSSAEDLASSCSAIGGFMRSFIEGQGWPVPEERSSDAASLRALGYETLGSLAKTTPSTVRDTKLSLVRWLLRSIN